MKAIKKFFKRICAMQIALIVMLSLIFNALIVTKEVKGAYTQYTKTGIAEFPESYREKLTKLSELHPNWTFTAYYTGIPWSEFMRNETGTHLRNTVHNSSAVSWKDTCNQVASGYACASSDIVAYYADPRNFITETSVFQFLEMSYNSSVHNKAGVESIIKDTFMDRTVTIKEKEEETSAKAKIDNNYIIVVPETKNKEIASTLNITEYEVKDKANNILNNDLQAITGNTFKDKKANKQYTIVMLGDIDGNGVVGASDYIAIKNHIADRKTLGEIESKAADVGLDGGVTATDYIKVKNHIAGRNEIALTDVSVKTREMAYSDIIMDAAKESGISPYSIAIKIIQEVGRQGSKSVSGDYAGYEGYYNFFNIGANDTGNAIENGLKYAREHGWNNQYKSIVEGAKFMSDTYIGVGQNTAYFYKFDVIDGSNGLYWHQYMTNIEDPSSQAKNLYNTYAKNSLLDASLNFIIPVYENMPNICSLPSTIDKNLSTSYYINGTGVNFRSGPTTSSASLGTLGLNEIVTVEQMEVAEADGYTWAKIKRANGSIGYVANRYLVKCT